MGPFYREFVKRESATGMIFDVDGTLLDSMPVWDHSGERYLASLGIHAPSSLGRVLFAKTMQQGAKYMKEKYHLLQSEEEIQAGVTQTVAEAYCKETKLKQGAKEFLDTLKEADIPMTVVTSTDRPLVLAAFRRLGLEGYFQKIFTCTEFGSGKDEPAVFRAAAAQMGSMTESTWVAEDALYAIRTAKAAGYRIIGVADASSSADENEIRKLADIYIKDFRMEI